MNREDITNAFYETIKDSMEWASMFEGKEYGSFVDGVVAMAEKMIDLYCNMPLYEKVDDFNSTSTVSKPQSAVYTSC